MREIKFRGFSISKKDWIYGYPWIVPGVGFYYILTGKIEIKDCSIEKYEVYPSSIGQYTGLKDRKDKEIYEGDIFHLGDKNIKYIVEWVYTGFEGKQHKSSSSVGLAYWHDKIEILGNVLENPELLEV